MKRQFRLLSEIENSKRKQKMINRLLIGIFLLVTVLLFCGCKQIEYVYIEPERVPITCIDDIKTPLDMAKCLYEYKS